MARGGGRPVVAIILSDEERSYLERQARRDRVGRSFRSVARSSRIALRDCRARWWGRIAKDRIDGLLDEPRPGRPRRIQDDQVAAVIERMLATTPPGATHRSIRSMVR